MSKKIEIGKKILSANEEYAKQNSTFLAENKKLCLNMISSPGSGKTTILTKTITELNGRLKIGVIEGDICTELDAQRIRKTNAPAIQIETQGSCHLSASQVTGALDKLPVKNLDLIFIENVGNLVCPTAFELGENAKVVVLSVPEGDDKPLKYPLMFSICDVLLVNKIDYLGMADFDMNALKDRVFNLNPKIKIFEVSCKTGEGIHAWVRWLTDETKAYQR